MKIVGLKILILSVALAMGTACRKKRSVSPRPRPSRETGGNTTKKAKGRAEGLTTKKGPYGAKGQRVHHEPHHRHRGHKPPEVKLPPSGHLGAVFSLRKDVPLKKLLSRPTEYEGKRVRVSGKVMAQCYHRRGWFALSKDGSRPWLRILTAPRFYLPKMVIGMNATAEGTARVRKISPGFARHMAKAHKLFGGNPDAIRGPVIQATLMATGARFTK